MAGFPATLRHTKEALESVEWQSQDVYRILGRSVLVRSTSSKFASQVRRLFGQFAPKPFDGTCADMTLSFLVAESANGITDDAPHLVYRDGTQIAQARSFHELCRHLEWQLEKFAVQKVDDHYLLHAAAMAKDGIGIIFPGPSGSGKSTLALALLLQGYSYLSDELAAIDLSTGQLQPFPKPIGIKDMSVNLGLAERNSLWWGPKPGETFDGTPNWYANPGDIAPESVSVPVPIRLVVFPTYDANAENRLEELLPTQGIRRLFANSVNFPRFGKLGLDLLVNMAQDTRCFSLTYNCLNRATESIKQLFDGTRVESPSSYILRDRDRVWIGSRPASETSG